MKFVRLLAAGSVALLALTACGEDEPDAGGSDTTVSAEDRSSATSAPATGDTDTTSGAASATSAASSPSTAPATTAPADLATELPGRTFLSTSVEGFTLVEGTQIEITFDGANIGARGGCNQLAGTWTVDGDVLVVPPMAQTQMACEPASLMDQDTWLSSVLTSRPTLALDGDTLTITAEGATVTLVDREVADPDRPLEGTTWTVDSLVTADAVSSLPLGARPPTLLFENGNLSVDTGCNTGRGGYTIDGDTVTFDPIATTRMACVDEAGNEIEQHVLTVLTGSATVEIEAGTLTLTNGANGLVAQATEAGS